MSATLRLTAVLTHPAQYMSPWFREITASCPELSLTVLYAAVPAPQQQGVEFGEAFSWDVDLLEGYDSRTLLAPQPGQRFDSSSFRGVDVSGIEAAIRETRPDVVLVPGWHSQYYLRALAACRRLGIPVLYRGDSNLFTAPDGLRRLGWHARTRMLLRLFSGYLSVGTRAREYLERHGAPEPLTAHSPAAVDVDYFAAGRTDVAATGARGASRQEFGAGPDDFVVLFAGKFIARKRPHDVLQAVQQLGPRAMALMVGNGALAPALKQAAVELGVRVHWPGFLNQSALRRALVAADCLALPSDALETWGLVVNESLAAGTPAVVSEHVGCGPDLIVPGVTGEVAATGSVESLAGALQRVRRGLAEGRITAAACQAQARTHSYGAATAGMLRGARRVVAHRRRSITANPGHPRVMLLSGAMVFISGIERMSFEILGVIRRRGAAVHCIVNGWDSSAIVQKVEEIDGSWSLGQYRRQLARTLSPLRLAGMLGDVLMTSAGLLRDAVRFRPTAVFIPEYHSAIRSAPALIALRGLGVRTVLRLGNAPETGRLKRLIWRRLINAAVSDFVCISQFVQRELLAHGIPPRKSRVIINTAPRRNVEWPPAAAPEAGKLLFIGQIIPPKGLDVLLDATSLLLARGHAVSLDVAGNIDGWEGPDYAGYRAGILARAARPDLAGRVRFLGVREDVPALLAATAVHCVPSRMEQKEGLGNVVLEAKRVGVPSVVTRSGALPEIVSHRENGWICDVVTAEALAEGIEYFLASDEVRAAAATAARASSAAFGPERFAAQWATVFGL